MNTLCLNKNFTPKMPPIETLWCKIHVNPTNQKSHSWAPLPVGAIDSSVLECLKICTWPESFGTFKW
jgi:hypothetical protein